MVEGVNVPGWAESRHLPNRFGREYRTLPEPFTGMDVREVNLDERQSGIEQCIKNRVANLRQRPGVDDHTARTIRRLLDEVDYQAFVVRLEEFCSNAKLSSFHGDTVLNLGKRRGAVYRSIPLTEIVQVRSIYYKNRCSQSFFSNISLHLVQERQRLESFAVQTLSVLRSIARFLLICSRVCAEIDLPSLLGRYLCIDLRCSRAVVSE